MFTVLLPLAELFGFAMVRSRAFQQRSLNSRVCCPGGFSLTAQEKVCTVMAFVCMHFGGSGGRDGGLFVLEAMLLERE